MRFTLLRILMAIIVGLWSPLCCCQAALFAGTLTGTPVGCGFGEESAAAPTPRCCEHCCDAASTSGSSDGSGSSDQDQPPSDRTPCNDCPACLGTLGLARLAGSTDLTLQTLGSPTPVLVVAWPIESSLVLTDAQPRPPARPPDHLARDAGGRALLRWHCALVV